MSFPPPQMQCAFLAAMLAVSVSTAIALQSRDVYGRGLANRTADLTEAYLGSGNIGWGCFGETFTTQKGKSLPGLIDGITDVDSQKTCNGVNVVGFATSKQREGQFLLNWGPTPDNQNGRYSFAYSSDGTSFTRMGECDQYNGQAQLLTDGMLLDAPTEAFKYLAISTACWNQNLREVTWVSVPTPAPPATLATPPATPCDNSTGTCTISEDPHIEVFDGAQISLSASSLSVETASVVGDQWLVKSGLVSIQARMANDDTLAERNLFVRAVAIGGAFLKGNTMVIGSLEDQVTWNGKPILQEDEVEITRGHLEYTSSFSVDEKEFFVKATRNGNSFLVQNPSQVHPGLTVEMPLGLSLVVNRLNHHINVAIKMPPQEGGQDGLCGNFNGIAGDDSMEMAAKRSSPKVLPSESLFQDGSFE